jgi:hypothetical protein
VGSERRKQKPATTLEGLENQLISDAYVLAHKQILNGTAPAMLVVHFLKLGSTRGRLEAARLEQENLLLAAKAEQIAQSSSSDELFEKALKAMSKYNGQEVVDEDEEDYQ